MFQRFGAASLAVVFAFGILLTGLQVRAVHADDAVPVPKEVEDAFRDALRNASKKHEEEMRRRQKEQDEKKQEEQKKEVPK